MEHTNRCAERDKNNLQFTVTNDEMMNLIGIIFLSGYNKRTCETDYWSKSPDLECLIVASAMSRTRFQHIKSYLHAADNQNLSETKMAKIEPLYQILNEKFQRYGIFHENLSIDESMVPYFGRHSCKQFIRGKPIRCGYKIWMLASNTGLPYRVAIYQGKENGGDSDKPLGYRVVTSSLSPCANPSDHHVFFDNFSSYQLMKTLSEKGFKATGTFRADRTNGCPLKCVKEFKKMDRGVYQYFTSGDHIELIRWNDNNVVTIGSNAVSVEPVGNVKRWKRGKGSVNVSQPHDIKAYNKCMGGVDLVDRALSDLRPNFNGEKWYWSLIINAHNLGFVYCWQLHQLCTKPKGDQKLHCVLLR